jgi:hypothetical protein
MYRVTRLAPSASHLYPQLHCNFEQNLQSLTISWHPRGIAADRIRDGQFHNESASRAGYSYGRGVSVTVRNIPSGELSVEIVTFCVQVKDVC